MNDYLKFSPDILRRLGEELVPDIDQGIIELVKNGYDADATTCTIAIEHPDPPPLNWSTVIVRKTEDSRW